MIKKILAYFVKGLLIVLPIGLTIYIIVRTVKWLNSIFDIGYFGVGILIALVCILVIGMIFSGIAGNVLFKVFDEIIVKIPLVNVIYSSIKDLMEAFVGDKRKFNEPVMVDLYANGIKAIGFITRKDLHALDITGMVAVYMPYSYALSGHFIIVPIDKITPIDANASEIMRFIVSGGVSGLQEAK